MASVVNMVLTLQAPHSWEWVLKTDPLIVIHILSHGDMCSKSPVIFQYQTIYCLYQLIEEDLPDCPISKIRSDIHRLYNSHMVWPQFICFLFGGGEIFDQTWRSMMHFWTLLRLQQSFDDKFRQTTGMRGAVHLVGATGR